MNPLPLAIAELRAMRSALPLVVALLAVAIAGGLSITMIERALRESAVRVADDFDLVVGAAGSETQLVLAAVYLRLEPMPVVDGAVIQRLQADPRVKTLAPVAFGDSARGYPVIGTTLDLVSRWGRLAPAKGRMFAGSEEAVIGAAVTLPLGTTLHPAHLPARGDLLGRDNPAEAEHRHGAAHYTVVGRMPPLGSAWDKAILVPIESVWEIHGLASGHEPGVGAERLGPPWSARQLAGAPLIVVKPRSVADAYALRALWRRPPTTAAFSGEVLSSLLAAIGDASRLVGWIAVGAQILVGLAVLAVIVVIIAARRRSLAALNAIGAPRTYLMAATAVALAAIVGVAVLLGLAIALLTGWLAAAPLVERATGLVIVIRPTLTDFVPALIALALAPACGALLAAVGLRGDPTDRLRG